MSRDKISDSQLHDAVVSTGAVRLALYRTTSDGIVVDPDVISIYQYNSEYFAFEMYTGSLYKLDNETGDAVRVYGDDEYRYEWWGID